VKTAVALPRLAELNASLVSMPPAFSMHRKLERARERRGHILDAADERTIDWSTAEELAFLRQRGCMLGQGYYFSRPVPPEEIIAYAFGGLPNADALRSA